MYIVYLTHNTLRPKHDALTPRYGGTLARANLTNCKLCYRPTECAWIIPGTIDAEG